MMTSSPRNLFVTLLATAVLLSPLPMPRPAVAGEGGVTHVVPGATATMTDLPPTSPGWIIKPMYLNYKASQSATIPTAAGLTSNIEATANTVAIALIRSLEKPVLGGAHYTFAVALPYVWQDISANIQTPRGSVVRSNKVDGFGDLTVLPVMLAWKSGNWQSDATLAIYAPTGSYEKGRLGNTGLNYWTFDPVVGVLFANKATGFNAMLHAGYGMNTKNSDTDYQSGSLLHFDAAVQQILPVGSGFMTLGAEAFYFSQMTGDSGAGAVLGNFKGRTSGLGPVLGYIQPLGKQAMMFELKWLPELDTQNRLKGDYVWLKMVYKF